jgi:hypothetical protein
MNVMRLNFHPEGLRLHTVDWEVSAGALLRRLERDVARQPHDAGLHNLLIEVRGYPGVDALPRPAFPEIGDLLVPVTYRIADQELSLFTTISVIGDAHDLTLAELRIETFWPVDEESKRLSELLLGRT